jgi:ribonucleoside-diphosphate reductase beta chain
MSVFSTTNSKHHTTRNMFFDEQVDVARYDIVRYPQFEKLTDKQISFFWRPEEVELSRDSKDFKLLTEHEKHIFTSNLKRQILLDSVQGRAPSAAFLPICSLPELETWIQTWTFFETIHSRSYTHIIRNVYSDPSKVFDEMMDIREIVDCAGDISKYYDELIYMNNARGAIPNTYRESPDAQYNHKKALWLCLNAVNALEGVRFYVSFACSWAFAEVKKMEGNAKIIKFIARDENVHLASTQQIIKLLPKEDPQFKDIMEETRADCINMFEEIFQQEKQWAKYLFQHGSIIGLNEQLLCDYVEWIGQKRMNAIGLKSKTSPSNPLPWTSKWISGSEVQPAPQEVELSSYLIGGIDRDVTTDTFKNFSL